MSLTFANFKQMIPSQILTRGRDYLRQGSILDISFDEEELFWEAQIEGTELYEVRVEQGRDGALACTCTCPYDLGEHCKHVAALLYAIEESFPEYVGKKPKKKAAKRQTRHDKLRQLVEKAPQEVLAAALLELAQQNRDLLNQLLIRFDSGSAKPMDYRRLVKDALRSGRDSYGYLDYYGSNRAAQKVDMLLQQAQEWVTTGQAEKAISLYQAVIDETVPVISHADDSNGSLGDCISVAVQGLADTTTLLTDAGRAALFTFCLERGANREFRGWDWGWELLEIAQSLTHDPTRRTMLETTLDTIEKSVTQDDFYSRFTLEKTAFIRLGLIEGFEGGDSALAFLRSKIHLDDMRMILIERSMEEGRLDEALTLIQAGIATSQEKRLPGLTNQYQALQVKLLQITGDTAAMLEVARDLWLNTGYIEMWQLLKASVPAAEWPTFVEGLIKVLHQSPSQLAWLYAEEGRWHELLAMIQSETRRYHLIEAYRHPLETHLPSDVVALYEKITEAILASASNRSQYQQVVLYLQRIKNLDPSGRAETIAQRIREQYPKRPALLDELKPLLKKG
jgi:uncharacterized Zn finger protein